ncbi:MAG: GTP 3',8-cyclase MoaA [Planctomycetota bacterium]|jgi:cyclic pyranopterin phosphate synthase
MSRPQPVDQFSRPIRNLRISVTDRCNLRCTYCMPEKNYVWLPREDILTFGEIRRLARLFADCGADRLRVTGGEPLVRRDLHQLIGNISEDERIKDIALTTNAVLLPEQGQALVDAGLQRITVSLDTLLPERFKFLAGRDQFAEAMAGIDAACKLELKKLKLNMVVQKGVNDDELLAMLEFARDREIELRYIEYMDVGGATLWNQDLVLSRKEILQRLQRRFGEITPEKKADSAPADRYRLSDGYRFGIISSTTEPFCSSCDRSRITADGMWFTCLYARQGINLRDRLRFGASDEEMHSLIDLIWNKRVDRGAEQRLELRQRSPLADSRELRADPHLEMHTRGG